MFWRLGLLRTRPAKPYSGLLLPTTAVSVTNGPAYSGFNPCVGNICLPLTPLRGAKTKETFKLESLSQGALPPTPTSEIDVPEAPVYPPVIQQHLNHVKQFHDCVVLTRVGNFYELYAEQAAQYGPLLNLKVAQKRTALGPVYMSGFQFSQLDRYLKTLVQVLKKQVAICEEIRNSAADQAKNGGLLYTRRISRVITAGTLVDENFMDPYENNFLLSIHADVDTQNRRLDTVSTAKFAPDTIVGLAWVDLSSGDFFTQRTDFASLGSAIARIRAREIVLDACLERLYEAQLDSLVNEMSNTITYHETRTQNVSLEQWFPVLEKPIPEAERLLFTAAEIAAGSILLDYVKGKLFDLNISLRCPVRCTEEEYMQIDKQTLRGLEIRSTLHEDLFQGSLLQAIRRTTTKSGARLLCQRLVAPSMSLSVINSRLDLVAEMLQNQEIREEVMQLLRRTSDTLRLLQRFSIGRGDADDLLALAKTIEIVVRVSAIVRDRLLEGPVASIAPGKRQSNSLWAVLERLEIVEPSRLATRILEAIDEDGLAQQHEAEEAEAATFIQLAEQVAAADVEGSQPLKGNKSASPRPAVPEKMSEPDSGEIWIMRRTASTALRRAHTELDNIMTERLNLNARLRDELSTNTLTLKWTPQLGHFCHVKGKDARSELPGARSSRLEYAKSRIRAEEQRIFSDLRKQVIENLVNLRRNAAVLDELDVACSSAKFAMERDLVRPVLHSGTSHHIVGGRHPMVDVGLQEHGRLFTPNDCTIGDSERIMLITGPNMAGKSTYLRQNALISILAQTGCFVPAAYAEIGLVDKVFSRIGSADNLYHHQSTFMVEMLEVAEILNQATPRSFVIMDEVGRGTTPEDGVAVGYACLHHLHHRNQCRTLFATHFHKLIDMTAKFDKLAYYCTDVAEEADGSWVYIHKLRKGVNRDSHALKVARLAGLPEEAIAVAGRVLEDLRKEVIDKQRDSPRE
ncbi:hypothetical protein MBLNU459_g4667t2 [Dothideomycetes sp. NU459]